MKESDETYSLSLNLTGKVINSLTIESITYEDIDTFALKSDIPTDNVTNEELTNTLNNYALKTDISLIYKAEQVSLDENEYITDETLKRRKQ